MNWGNLSRGFSGVAIKQLSSHEVNPAVSRGHEFQGANNLVGLLGTEDCRDRPTTYYFISDDGAEPRVREIVHSVSSWYDSRRNQPHRNPEWRLYYPSTVNLIQNFCQAGDLLLLALRNDGTLAVFLAPAGSVSEQVLLQAFGVTQSHYRQSGQVRWMKTAEAPALDFVGAETMEQLSLAFAEARAGEEDTLIATVEDDAPAGSDGDGQVSRIADLMLERWPEGRLGSNQEVVELVIGVCDPDGEAEADMALERWLEVAEASYRIWEKETARRFIAPLRNDSAVSDMELIERIGSRWMSFRQSRVSRAGKVMEEFLGILFLRAGLRFATGSSAMTENGKMPDFLFPDGDSYRDESFPAGRLRILGSKTSFKDRWRQILSEGDRVPEKHGVTRDTCITASMFEQMRISGFIVVMPQPIIARYSISRPTNLVSLTDFIEEVRGLQLTE